MSFPAVVDCHAHAYRHQLAHDGFGLDRILARCDRFGVAGAVFSIFYEDGGMELPLEEIERISDRHDAVAGVSFGLMPPTAALPAAEQQEIIADATRTARALAAEGRIVAIGEVGLDYYWPLHNFLRDRGLRDKEIAREMRENRESLMREPELVECVETQRALFQASIDLAVETGLSLVIHGRDAYPDILAQLAASEMPPERVMLHCFAGTVDEAVESAGRGCTVSVPSSVGYRESFRAPARAIDLGSMVIETDSPYHSPFVGLWKAAGEAVEGLEPPERMSKGVLQDWIAAKRKARYLELIEERYPRLTFEVLSDGEVLELPAAEYLIRGSRRRNNEPTFVRCAATDLAALKGVGLEEVCEVTTANARRLFPGLLRG